MTTPVFAKTVTVSSIGELISHVTETVVGENQNYWYRGQHNAAWSLVPNIYRQHGDKESVAQYERHLAHTFRSRAGMRHGQTPGFEEIPRWIALMQHYGLPTRLLDWSRSPLVACYFAVERYIYEEVAPDVDACVWMLDPYTLNDLQGLGEFTLTIDSGKCRHLINAAFYHDAEFDAEVIQAVMASETDVRMFVQQGAFTIHSTATPLDHLPLNGPVLQKIVIPAKSVRRLANDLAVCGFRKGDIYPDLQNLARDLSSFRVA